MYPNAANSLISDLAEMVKAVELLPQVQHDLEVARADAEGNRQIITNREEAILRYKAEIETLNAKVRATEAERDDAELRFLELDEKTHQVMGMLIDFEGKAKGARLILNPPKPIPMPEPVTTTADYEASWAEHEAKPEPVYTASGFEGQREGNPTSTGSTPSPMPTTDAPVDTSPQIANPTEPVASTAEPAGPYSGKRYYDHPTYVHRLDWVAGGGTEADYDWRPHYQSK